jgi:hypothetical protein
MSGGSPDFWEARDCQISELPGRQAGHKTPPLVAGFVCLRLGFSAEWLTGCRATRPQQSRRFFLYLIRHKRFMRGRWVSHATISASAQIFSETIRDAFGLCARRRRLPPNMVYGKLASDPGRIARGIANRVNDMISVSVASWKIR